jgi:hypothetical protein
MLDDEFSHTLRMYWEANGLRKHLFFCFKLQSVIGTDFILMFYCIICFFFFFFFFINITYPEIKISSDQEYAYVEFSFVIYI